MNFRQVLLAALLIAIVGGGSVAVPWFLWLGPHAVSARSGSNGPEATTSVTDHRYDGKTFEQWQACWSKELKSERRLDAVRAMNAFGTHGLSREAAGAVLQMAESCGREEDALRCEAVETLSRLNAEHDKMVKYLKEALAKELDAPRRNDVRFVSCCLDCLAKLGPAGRDAAPVVKRIMANMDELRPQAAVVLNKIELGAQRTSDAMSTAAGTRKTERFPTFEQQPIIPTVSVTSVPSSQGHEQPIRTQPKLTYDWKANDNSRPITLPTQPKEPNRWASTLPPVPQPQAKTSPLQFDTREPVIPPLPPVGGARPVESRTPPIPPDFRGAELAPLPGPSVTLPPGAPTAPDPRLTQPSSYVPMPPISLPPGAPNQQFPIPPPLPR